MIPESACLVLGGERVQKRAVLRNRTLCDGGCPVGIARSILVEAVPVLPNKIEKLIDINVDDLTLLTTLVVVNIEVSVSWLATSMAKSSPYYEVSASAR
jgi:hypothetical protein